MLHIAIALLGWLLLGIYLLYEYHTYGSDILKHFFSPQHAIHVIFHLVIFSMPLVTTFLGYLFYQKDKFLKKISGISEELRGAITRVEGEKAKSEAILEAIGDAISIQDTEYRVLYQNQRLKELVGSHVGEYCYRAYQHREEVCEGCHLAMSFRDGQMHKQERVRDTGKGLMYSENIATPLRGPSGKIIAGIEAVRDITERKKIEKALQESEEQYRDLFESASDLIQIVSPDGHFLFVNRAWRETLGYSEEEISRLRIFDIIAEESRPHCTSIFQRVMTEGAVPRIDTVFVARDGREIIVEGSANCKLLDGQPVTTRCMFRDVTLKRKMEEELLKIQKLESLGIFAGGIAHDFNNIMTVILGNVSLALTYLAPEDEMYEGLLDAEKASTHAKQLIQQLLTFSKGGSPVRKTLLLGDVTQETANFALRGSRVKSTLTIPEDLWPVEFDEGQIGQVINNLMINALQAMPEGGTVNIYAENVLIGEESGLPLKEGKYVKTTIEDSGHGIAKEHLQKVFDPFFTTKSKGSGLGLATSFSIIKKHDGYITVESEPGVGTKFHIYLPASEKEVIEARPVEEAQVSGKGRVLVMDDEELVRNVVSSMLRHLGYEVEMSVDGAEAITLYKEAKEAGRPFDVVIMDLTIPGGMGGEEAMEKLLKIDPRIRAIVSSGYSHDMVMANFRDYGFAGAVRKPYKSSELGEVVSQVLEDSRK